MFKNVNQVTLPTGLVLILVGIVMAIFLPLINVHVGAQWISFPILLGISFALFSFGDFLTRVAGFVFLVIALIIFGFAVT